MQVIVLLSSWRLEISDGTNVIDVGFEGIVEQDYWRAPSCGTGSSSPGLGAGPIGLVFHRGQTHAS